MIRSRCQHLIAVLIAAVMVVAVIVPCLAQSTPPASPATRLDQDRSALDGIEAALKQSHLTTGDLIEIGRQATPVRNDLQALIDELEPQVAQVDSRLKQLGKPPAPNAAPEPPALAAERAALTKQSTELGAELKQARLAAVRADQLIQQATKLRFAAYARALLARSWSVLDPAFWVQAAAAVRSHTGRIVDLLSFWQSAVRDSGVPRIIGAILTLLVIGIGGLLVQRALRRRIGGEPAGESFAKVRLSFWAFLSAAVTMPILVVAAIEVLDIFAMLPATLMGLAIAAGVAVAIASFGRGVAIGVLAADESNRRLVPYDDRTARSLHAHLVAAARIAGIALFVGALNKQTLAPQPLVVLTGLVFVLAVLGVMLHLLFELRASASVFDADHTPSHLWIRGIAWLLTVVIAVALIAGYVRFAEFLCARLIVGIIIFGLLYLLLKTSDLVFSELFAADTVRGRAIVANLGLHPRRLALIGELLNGAVRLTLVLLALALIFGPWEGATIDLLATVQNLPFGITVGETTISFTGILAALAVLAIGVIVTRALQRWMEVRLLPRTNLETGQQQSVAVIFGYVGIIAAISLSLAALGIDLQKIALVAGALSVGIGFGLQSIVSNFVSGLILLTERPIKVGDWIVAKGEEGFVRRIHVRATEVETFERASVIIPNSDLISGVVKNWTHGNLMGRITIKVGVSYGSDADKVQNILLAIADEHPAILKIPPPYVLFMNFGDSALEFELRCVVRDVQQCLSVRSELNFAVLARFRAEGIEIPFPQRTLHFAGNAPLPSPEAS